MLGWCVSTWIVFNENAKLNKKFTQKPGLLETVSVLRRFRTPRWCTGCESQREPTWPSSNWFGKLHVEQIGEHFCTIATSWANRGISGIYWSACNNSIEQKNKKQDDTKISIKSFESKVWIQNQPTNSGLLPIEGELPKKIRAQCVEWPWTPSDGYRLRSICRKHFIGIISSGVEKRFLCWLTGGNCWKFQQQQFW